MRENISGTKSSVCESKSVVPQGYLWYGANLGDKPKRKPRQSLRDGGSMGRDRRFYSMRTQVSMAKHILILRKLWVFLKWKVFIMNTRTLL